MTKLDNDLISRKALLEAHQDLVAFGTDTTFAVRNLITNAPTVEREGWVSVEDRLPNDIETGISDSFLVMLKDDNPLGWVSSRPVMCEYKFLHGKTWTAFDAWTSSHIDFEGYVTHWKPLPVAPTNKE